MSVKVVFLYSEVAGYFLSCAQALSKKAEVLVFRWPVNKEAPFDLSAYENLQIKDRSKFNQTELEKALHEFNPDVIVCSGWMDKGYLKAAKSFKKKIPVVLTMDNHWTGSIKQQIAGLTSNFHFKRTFTHAWVPGHPQVKFAEKLGFKGDRLITGFYCADTSHFEGIYQRTIERKRSNFPKRFLYVARYVEHKGIFEMWQAFQELKEENSDWELWCIGTGDEWENRIEDERIQHFGFVQPSDIEEYIAKTGVYILPSKFEPWGVTAHEFAAAGFPLLLSDQIGAKWDFLKEGENGFEFESGSVEAIKNQFRKIMNLSDDELVKMSERSHALGMSNTPDIWSDKIVSIVERWKN